MPDSPLNDKNADTQKQTLCDFCGETTALIYCKADTAKLCIPCDRQVHSTNQLFTKHTRFQLCDLCSTAPATILCFTEHTVLCQNCDYDLHNQPGGSSVSHDRRPLEGFTGSPSVFELSSFVGLEGLDCKSLLFSEENDDHSEDQGFSRGLLSGFEGDYDGFEEFFVWDTPAVVSLDDLIVSTDRSHNFHAMGVPPLPKDRNFTCGQQKQEIIRQLCELAKLEPAIKQDLDFIDYHNCIADEDQKNFSLQYELQVSQHDEEHPVFRGNEARAQALGNDAVDTVDDIFISSSLSESHVEECVLLSDTQSGICSTTNLTNPQISMGTESLGLPPKVSTHEVCAADRDSALSRYKEKKRTRRFDKHIRYESRKLQAENRIRVKGRFAKIDNRRNQV